MDSAAAWQQFFESWPDSIPKQGIIVTAFQETIPFTRFLVSPGILALERDRPDTIGARKVLVSFSAISAVKLTDTGDFSRFATMGFS